MTTRRVDTPHQLSPAEYARWIGCGTSLRLLSEQLFTSCCAAIETLVLSRAELDEADRLARSDEANQKALARRATDLRYKGNRLRDRRPIDTDTEVES